MKVTVLAKTVIEGVPASVAGTPFGERVMDDVFYDRVTDADALAEVAGRACYQSWNLPNAATAENDGYLANILAQGHFSVLEHSSVTFYVEGVSRALTHELIRHRHLSYSELSQRFVDVSEANFIIPPALREVAENEAVTPPPDTLPQAFPEAVEAYEAIVVALMQRGYTRKQAREAARSVMPNGTETRIVVTGNLRAWRDVLGKRWHAAADAEIRQFAGEVLRHLRDIAPASVQDIPDTPYE